MFMGLLVAEGRAKRRFLELLLQMTCSNYDIHIREVEHDGNVTIINRNGHDVA
jgi:uncharacterized protein (DUF111 family)